ncbi:fatty-acyl-CoA synthase [Sinomonas cellulolyticus]|jgi:fatty-acyl-CoA synthase|uniref:O-succinylbenzoate--CoA ligase n=1 Tax=Sinomonas cellulolyticus TaxID=2801916 RepID=A0ABS1K2Y5_9MICC|nr:MULTISPECIES: o-succinylbenzoate--CoA ligase [Sinomonas]MBL0706024.1 o-succinylbenzoate--CoA ligase [Sinomonas cellulolyticus]GHG43104.1 fatty-acyl-CoA synthase [Sinomonas sp. KCTC 49339]
MYNNGVGSWLHRRRPKSGPKAALIAGERTYSYDELSERADRLANALRRRGVARGDRVAYLGENDPAFVETFFAAGILGAIFIPLNTRLAAPELQFQLQDSGARLLVNGAALEELAAAAAEGTGVLNRLVVGGSPAVAHDAAPAASAPGSPPVVGRGVEAYEEALASAPAEVIDEAVTHDDGAMILYTSGTTGRPKGALLTHGNITWNCINVITDMDVNRNDIALMISPLFHVASLDMGLLPMLLKGATVVLEQKFDPARVLAAIEKHRITALSGVPTTYQLLAEHPDWATTDISSLDKLTCGGSAVPMRVLEAYEERGLGFSNGYGMTETAPGATTLPVWRSREKAGSSGLPQFFTDIRIVDPIGQVLGPGEVGEIQIAGPNVIREYWNRSDATRESYADGIWFKSGDMGYRDEEGFLFVSDRLKDMIISGGENIYPAEVEALIVELDEVASVAVIGVPDDKWGEVPKAIVTLREGATLTQDQVAKHLDGRLARYKIPKSVVFVEEMPRTASGKIRKAELRKQYAG